jgi:hypothetical protein
MKRSVLLTSLTVVVATILAVAIAFLVVDSAQATPLQANVPVFTYGSG